MSETTARVFAACVALAVCLTAAFGAEEAARPNVLLISLDTLRADHVGCYGYERDTSPNLDKLAAEGILFENLTAASSWTIPSHMSLFTSLYPSVHGVEDSKSCLGDGVPTLAEIVAKHGYATAGFVTGPSLNHQFGFHRGFQFYDDFTVTLMHETNLFHDLDADKSGINQVPTNHVVTNLATAWLKKNGGKRFFLFVHYWDCHNDYIPPAPFDKKYDPAYKGKEDGRNVPGRQKAIEEEGIAREDLKHMVALYDGEIAHTDHQVGRLLATLDELKLSGNTLVIVVSDHGEGFLDHGRLHHGNSLYEELVHVPFLMRWPGVLPEAKRIKGNVSHVDVLPTLLALLHIPTPAVTHGVDLSPVCRSESALPERMVFSELNLCERMRAVRWGPFKVVEEYGKPAGPLIVVRGNKDCPAGECGLAESDMAARRNRLARALRAGPAAGAKALAKPARPDEKTMRLLRSLGYLE